MDDYHATIPVNERIAAADRPQKPSDDPVFVKLKETYPPSKREMLIITGIKILLTGKPPNAQFLQDFNDMVDALKANE